MYKTTVCVDLRSFDREDPSYGVEDYFQKLGFVPDTICFLNFQVMFLFGFKEITDEYLDPICVGQNGTPCSQRWTCRDLYGLIKCIRQHGSSACLGILSNTISPVWKNTQYQWQYREVLQTMRGNRLMWGEALNVLKRLNDGRYFEDIYIEKLRKVIDAFEFDGYVAGDGMLGLRGPRETLADTDFSVDMVSQFTEYMGADPIEIEDYDERADYITENLMPQWIEFWCFRWSVHASKVSAALQEGGKVFMAIDAWSRNPEEVRTAFGIDYKRLYQCGLKAVFVQARETNKWRKHREGEYVREQNSIYTFLAHKAYEPGLEYYWAQATVNVPEFWNTVQDLPNVAERENYGYLWTHYYGGDGWKPVCSGVCIIWGNDLTEENWRWLKQRWDQAYDLRSAYLRPVGITLLWSDFGVRQQDADNKRYGSQIAALIQDGVCIQSVVSEEMVEALKEKETCYYVAVDDGILKRHPHLAANTVLLRDGFMEWNRTRYSYCEGIQLLKGLGGIKTTKGRVLGFENTRHEYVVSIENPDNLFYEQIYLAVDRKIRDVRALPPREWYVLPHSTEQGSLAVSVSPDASLQLMVGTDPETEVEMQFRKKDLGI
mgnify:CR=1 FL=1